MPKLKYHNEATRRPWSNREESYWWIRLDDKYDMAAARFLGALTKCGYSIKLEEAEARPLQDQINLLAQKLRVHQARVNEEGELLDEKARQLTISPNV